MTPLALYQEFYRFSAVVMGIDLFWLAAFSALIWRLDYEPVRIKPLPKSRRERSVWIAIESVTGVMLLGFAATMRVPDTITTMRVLTAAMFALIELVFLAFFWTSIGELRRAVRLQRRQLHQQTGE